MISGSDILPELVTVTFLLASGHPILLHEDTPDPTTLIYPLKPGETLSILEKTNYYKEVLCAQGLFSRSSEHNYCKSGYFFHASTILTRLTVELGLLFILFMLMLL